MILMEMVSLIPFIFSKLTAQMKYFQKKNWDFTELLNLKLQIVMKL